MIHAKNYEKLSKFVKVTAKILSVPFSGHGVLAYRVIDYKKYNDVFRYKN